MKKKQEMRMGLSYPILKLFRIMKLSILLFFVSLLQVYASDSFAQKTKLSLKVENSSIESILLEIENQSAYKFIYNKADVDVEAQKSIDLNNKSIDEVLDVLFEGENVNYSFYDKQVILTKTNSNVNQAQTAITVRGTVTNTNGEPIPGATVVIKGTTNGTITDFDGNYTLSNVQSDQVLIFSFVGMKSVEVLVGGRMQINVSLEEETIG